MDQYPPLVQAPTLVQRLNGIRRRMSWKQAFTALKYPNYKLWFWGQMVSLFGSWMQVTAQGFFVYELTKSPAYLGFVGFANGIPTWLFMLYGGVIADRIPRRRLLIITQSSMMVLAFILAGLTFLQVIKPWHIILLAFGVGAANAFDAPARQAFVLEMVGPDDMTNAIALNSAMFNTATAVGPAAAGLFYAFFGPAWCFTINGISFIAVIVALTLMRLKPIASRPARRSVLQELKEGVRYAFSHPMIRTLVATVGVLTVFGFAFVTIMPAWAVKVLGGDASTNGFLLSARGIGALLGALGIASLGRFNFRGKLLTLGTLVFPLCVLAFSFSRWLPLSLLILVGAGASIILIFNLSNSLIQTFAPDELRGRIMSIYSFVFFGIMPLGALWAGGVAEKFGETTAVVVGAVMTLLFAVFVWIFIPRFRRLS